MIVAVNQHCVMKAIVVLSHLMDVRGELSIESRRRAKCLTGSFETRNILNHNAVGLIDMTQILHWTQYKEF